MADIFISYKHPEDREIIRPIVEALKARGWSLWWCEELVPGQHWDRTIETELNNAKCVIVVWSPRSYTSDEVRTEAAEGRRRKCLIQLTIEGASRPTTFAGVQGIDLTGWRGATDDPRYQDLSAGIQRIVPDPPCNMYTFRGEGGLLRQKIDGHWAVGDYDACRIIYPELIRLDGNASEGTYWPANEGAKNASTIPENEQQTPFFDENDDFVAGTAVRMNGYWQITRLRPGSGVIVRVDTGRCNEHEPRPQENHGSVSGTDGVDYLIGGLPMTPKRLQCRSAIWQLPEGAALLVKSGMQGECYRLTACKNGLLAVIRLKWPNPIIKA